MNQWIFLLIVGIAISISISISIFAWKKTYIYKKKKKKFQKKIQRLIQKISKMPTDQKNQKILEYDKILDLCLHSKGLKGSTGEKMKQYQSFTNSNQIWSAHKFRNIIAHKIGFIIEDTDFKKAENAFLREFSDFLK